MGWIQLDDDHWAKEAEPDPEEIVSFTELNAQIDELQEQLDAFKELEIPENASAELKEAIEEWNLRKAIEKTTLEVELNVLKQKKKEILEA